MTMKMFTITIDVWAKSQRRPPFLFERAGGGGGHARNDKGGGSFGFKGSGICSSRRDDKEDSSNHCNGGNISTHEGGPGQENPVFFLHMMWTRRTMTMAAVTIDVSSPGPCRWAWPPSIRILNPCKPFPAVGGQGGNQ